MYTVVWRHRYEAVYAIRSQKTDKGYSRREKEEGGILSGERHIEGLCFGKVVFRASSSHTNELSGSATRDTIVSIIKGFFDKFDCALVAFIDTSTDNKGKARSRLFKSWFSTFASDDFIIEPREITVSGSESYSLLIIRKSYGNTAMIIEAFDKFIRLANTPDE